MATSKYQDELVALYTKNGVLRPRDIVEFARDETTTLHEYFQWDDSIAGEAYRVWQARQLIRTEVIVLPNQSQPIEMFVSLKSERNGEMGYRAITDVLSSPSLRPELLADALDELEKWRKKYEQIRELAEVFAAADAAINRRNKRKPKQSAPQPVAT